MNLVKSKDRVADYGEGFTPAWMVEAMLNAHGLAIPGAGVRDG